jgi:hypothetical protein
MLSYYGYIKAENKSNKILKRRNFLLGVWQFWVIPDSLFYDAVSVSLV